MQEVSIMEKSLRNLINEARVLALAARQNLAPRRIEGGGEIRTESPDEVRIQSAATFTPKLAGSSAKILAGPYVSPFL